MAAQIPLEEKLTEDVKTAHHYLVNASVKLQALKNQGIDRPYYVRVKNVSDEVFNIVKEMAKL